MGKRRLLWIDKTAGLPDADERYRALAVAGDFDLTVLAPRRWNENGRPIRCGTGERSGYRVIAAPCLFPGNYSRALYLGGLRSLMRAVRPQIIHLQEEPWSLFAWQTAAALSACDAEARLVFYSWENIYRDWEYASRIGFVHRPIDRRLHRLAVGALCPTRGAEAVLRRKGFAKPIGIAPYGIAGAFFAEAPLRPEPARPSVIGYAGRLLPMKGVDTLLEAVAGMDGVRLRVIGGGPDRERLSARAHDLGIADRVEWIDSIAPAQMPREMSRLDALVLPSRTTDRWMEQFGRVLCEAMALGVPVIGSDSGAIPEVIGDAGLVFPEGDAVALRDCLQQTLEPETRRRLAARGRERARQQFTWTAFAEGVAAFYDAI